MTGAEKTNHRVVPPAPSRVLPPLSSGMAPGGERLFRKQPHGEATRPISNGKIEVPSILLEPIAVDKENLISTVIADGYQKLEDVYRDVPRDRWPKK